MLCVSFTWTIKTAPCLSSFPYRQEEGWTAEDSKIFADRLSSEVATMQYVKVHTTIPVPHIIHHSVEVDSGGVGSPYIIMTKEDGVALSGIWDDMENSKP
jgi:hypothetical protein